MPDSFGTVVPMTKGSSIDAQNHAEAGAPKRAIHLRLYCGCMRDKSMSCARDSDFRVWHEGEFDVLLPEEVAMMQARHEWECEGGLKGETSEGI